jgi:hypothetical protein
MMDDRDREKVRWSREPRLQKEGCEEPEKSNSRSQIMVEF